MNNDYDFNQNKGKRVSIYQYIPTNEEKSIKEFKGILEYINQNYLILSDPDTGEYYLLLMKYTIYIKSDEEINFLNQFS